MLLIIDRGNLNHFNQLYFFDSFGTNIRLDLRGTEIMR